MGSGNQFFGLLNILIDGKMRAVEHNRCKTGLNTAIASVIGTVIQV